MTIQPLFDVLGFFGLTFAEKYIIFVSSIHGIIADLLYAVVREKIKL